MKVTEVYKPFTVVVMVTKNLIEILIYKLTPPSFSSILVGWIFQFSRKKTLVYIHVLIPVNVHIHSYQSLAHE